MKRYLFVGFLALVILMAVFQTGFSQTATGINRGNAVPLKALPQELQELDVKDFFIDSGALPAGTIQTIIGQVIVRHGGTKEAFFAAQGDAVCKSDIIFTLRDSRCRISFSTDDVLTMGEDSRIEIAEHIDDRKQQRKTSVFNMLRGKAMFYAVRLFKYRTAAMTVNTPTAVAGVRGTKFGVAVDEVADEVTVHCYRGPVDATPMGGAGYKAAVNPGLYLADASGTDFRYLLAQQGGQSDNEPVTLYDGESWTQKKGVYTDPDNQANHERDTSIGEPLLTGEGDAVDDTGLPASVMGEKAEDDGEKLGNLDLDDEIPPTGYTGPRTGYFTAMLFKVTLQEIDDIYASCSPQDFDTVPAMADGCLGFGVIEANWAAPIRYVEKVVNYFQDSAVLGPSWPIISEKIGANAYQEWGWWTVDPQFTIGEYTYKIIQGTYIVGDIESAERVKEISGVFAGEAWGVHFDPNNASEPDGVRMTGNFSCEVDGLAGTVDNFNLRVDAINGGPQFAEIQEATGDFSSNSFRIEHDYFSPNGTWSLYGVGPAFYGGGAGSLYKGNKIGGVWAMSDDPYYEGEGISAAGGFRGDKTGELR